MKRWRATIPVRRSFFYSTCQVVRRCLFLISFRFTVVIRDKSWSETDGECVLFTFSRHLSKQGPERGFSPPPPIHRNKIQSNNVNNLRKLFPPYYRVLVSNSTRSQIHNRISVWSGWNRYENDYFAVSAHSRELLEEETQPTEYSMVLVVVIVSSSALFAILNRDGLQQFTEPFRWDFKRIT